MDNSKIKLTIAIRLFVTFSLATLLIACVAENNYRGVAEHHWQELSGEQKQLIVDQAYEQELG